MLVNYYTNSANDKNHNRVYQRKLKSIFKDFSLNSELEEVYIKMRNYYTHIYKSSRSLPYGSVACSCNVDFT